ncbi:hypothetical protein CCHR01_18826 [Colletotrichum chrysophilum]|uniref:Uncharacterized protein n=1 Tax=Colletotrichum chrysophilum TaxID=1836956 RepID=A0AAD9A008_9PEZI|nr:hypothetical protein CCHR01_18826 [Colletotrichum chrysophilum]
MYLEVLLVPSFSLSTVHATFRPPQPHPQSTAAFTLVNLCSTLALNNKLRNESWILPKLIEPDGRRVHCTAASGNFVNPRPLPYASPVPLIVDIENDECLTKRPATPLPILEGSPAVLPRLPRLAVRPKIASSGNLGNGRRSWDALWDHRTVSGGPRRRVSLRCCIRHHDEPPGGSPWSRSFLGRREAGIDLEITISGDSQPFHLVIGWGIGKCGEKHAACCGNRHPAGLQVETVGSASLRVS